MTPVLMSGKSLPRAAGRFTTGTCCLLIAAALAAFCCLNLFARAESSGPDPGARWSELLGRGAFPYLLPLPEADPTPIDGTYTKIAAARAARVHCLRCPDYAPEGGVWKISFDRGTLRIIHAESGWRSIGTYFVAGDRLLIANDPVCHEALGLYAWRISEGSLVLEVVDDACAIRLRAANLTAQPWRSCRPPNTEAAVTGHWPVPEGCDW